MHLVSQASPAAVSSQIVLSWDWVMCRRPQRRCRIKSSRLARHKRVGALHFWQRRGWKAMITFWLRRACGPRPLMVEAEGLDFTIGAAEISRRKDPGGGPVRFSQPAGAVEGKRIQKTRGGNSRRRAMCAARGLRPLNARPTGSPRPCAGAGCSRSRAPPAARVPGQRSQAAW